MPPIEPINMGLVKVRELAKDRPCLKSSMGLRAPTCKNFADFWQCACTWNNKHWLWICWPGRHNAGTQCSFKPCDGRINGSKSGIISKVLSVALMSAVCRKDSKDTCEVIYKYDWQVCYLIQGPQQLHLSQQPLPSLQLLGYNITINIKEYYNINHFCIRSK